MNDHLKQDKSNLVSIRRLFSFDHRFQPCDETHHRHP